MKRLLLISLIINCQLLITYPINAQSNLVSSSLRGTKQSLSVYSVLGQQVYTEILRSTQGDNTIDLIDQPSGIYILSINLANQTFNQKLIINN